MSAASECPTGKVPYLTPQAAWATVRRIQGRPRRKLARYRGGRQRPTSPYQCSECGAWHTTSERDKIN